MKTLLIACLVLASFCAIAKEGRYQLLRINESPNSIHMVDTQSGKIWKQACYAGDTKECPVKAWSPMNVVGINVTEKDMWKMASDYEKQKADGTLTKVSEAESNRMPASVGGEKEEYQQVKGYIRSDGTYVAPYIRTSPNSTVYDNIRPRPKK